MTWTEFQALVLPYASGVPIPLLELHVRQAATEFCLKTKCWVNTLAQVNTSGTASVAIPAAPTNALIFDVEFVTVDGQEWKFAPTEAARIIMATASSQRVCFSQDLQTLTFNPLPQSALPVVVTVSLMPGPLATGLHASLARYADSIAHGAIASLLRVPGIEGSGSDWHEAMFRDKIKTESARLARMGVATGGARELPSFI